MKIELQPIGYVRNSRKGIEDDHWGGIISEIELTGDFTGDALKGIENFSHAEIIYYFDKADSGKIVTGSRPPRNNPLFPETGIFAQRGKNRPNHLGLSFVRIIEHKNKTLKVKWLDAIDGTPVLDIKPVFREFIHEQGEEILQPVWVGELMKNYWD